MNDHELDSRLFGSRPDLLRDSPQLDAAVEDLAIRTRLLSGASAPGRRSWWKRRRLIIPLLVAVAVGTSAAAVTYQFRGNPDVVIPISYTTASGHSYDCGVALHLSGVSAVPSSATSGGVTSTRADFSALSVFVKSHDWAGIGQDAYREAVAHPYVPAASERGEFTQANIDNFSFSLAINKVLSDQFPAADFPSDSGYSLDSNCSGDLQ